MKYLLHTCQYQIATWLLASRLVPTRYLLDVISLKAKSMDAMNLIVRREMLAVDIEVLGSLYGKNNRYGDKGR